MEGECFAPWFGISFASHSRRHSAGKWDDRGGSSLPGSSLHDGGSLYPTSSEGEIYFITICCAPRHENQLALPAMWEAIDEAIAHREAKGELDCRLALAMPDHFHALMGFPGSRSMVQVVTAFKSWLASRNRIRWQRDFFDHRLRSWESAQEKAGYIRMNPVRAGLVA
ncbi:MAG TPA: hypothetical protein VF258_05415, partial [Luteolibacter sp.]